MQLFFQSGFRLCLALGILVPVFALPTIAAEPTPQPAAVSALRLDGISLACHLQVSPDLPNDLLKGLQLLKISNQYAAAGQPEPAIAVLAQTVAVAQAIPDRDIGESVLREVAAAYAEAQQFDRATQLAQSLTSSFLKADAFASIAGSYAKAGQIDQAASVVNQELRGIADPASQGSVFASLAQRYAEAGQYPAALQLVNEMKLDYFKVDALAAIAVAYAEAGDRKQADRRFADARKQAAEIQDARIQETAFSAIVRRYAKVGKLTEALQLANAPEIGRYRNFALTEVVRAYAQAQQFEPALKVAAELQSAFPKSRALMAIADGYRIANQPEPAAQFLAQALALTQQIEDDIAQIIQIAEITGKYAELGQYQQAQQTANQIPDPNERDRWLALLKCNRP